MRGDRVRMDPGDYGTLWRINEVTNEQAILQRQTGDADETVNKVIRRIVPPAAIRLRVSTEGVPGHATLTSPETPISGRWRRAMMRFYDITPGRGAYLIGRHVDQTRAFASPSSNRRRKMGYEGSVRPARLPHRLLPIPTGPAYTPRSWAYGDVRGPVVKEVEGGRVSYTQGLVRPRSRKYRRK